MCALVTGVQTCALPISRFYPPQRRSAALGIFGTSNVGAAVTALLAPLVMAAMGWQTVVHVWAAALLILAILFLITTRDDPETAARRRDARSEEHTSELQSLMSISYAVFCLKKKKI